MKLISWHVQGIGAAQKRQLVKNIMLKNSLDVDIP